VRDFRRHLKNGRRAPNTIDTYLSAIDDFYVRRGLGKPRPGTNARLPRTFATQLIRDGKDPILVAELLGPLRAPARDPAALCVTCNARWPGICNAIGRGSL
jgi:hypothetical protein